MAKKYKTINGFTKQKMIEMIQSKNTGGRSTASDSNICMYRSIDENGNTNCCVVGAFIPDTVYKPEMEFRPKDDYGGTVTELLKHFPEVKPYMPLNRRGLMSMQEAHDNYLPGDDCDLRTTLTNWVEENVKD